MKDKHRKLEQPCQASPPVPINLDEVGTRILAAAEKVGTRKFAAQIAGVSVDQLARYLTGDTPPRLEPIARLAVAANVSMDWICFGKEHAPDQVGERIDPDLDLLEGLVATVRQALMDTRTQLPPHAEAKVIRLAYQLGLERQGQLDKKTLAEIIRLVA
ncbi:MAG: helix-turn-helix transcriptional regulator [Nitrococcus mobilis]|nr:helix-turn-helix transcriptional regulator [Nitrococcus mobilis]